MSLSTQTETKPPIKYRYHNPLFQSQSEPQFESTYRHYYNLKSEPTVHPSHQSKPSLLYYPPQPHSIHNIDPLQLPSMKHIDVDNLQECFGRSIQHRRCITKEHAVEIQRLYTENDELKSIITDIKQAQLNRDRAHQIHESQTRRLKQIVLDTEIDENVLAAINTQRLQDEQREQTRKHEMLRARSILQQQLTERQKARDDAKNEYLKDKADIDALVRKILTEDKTKYDEQQRKKSLAKAYMDKEYADRLKRKQMQKEEEALNNEKERKYFEEVARREMLNALKKKEQQDTKDKIFEQLCAEKAREQALKDYYDDMRNQLHDEEMNVVNKMKEQEEREKMLKQREELLNWAVQQKKMNQYKKEEEDKEERKIMQKMLDKFKEDDKLEMLNNEKRKQKVMEYQLECERQWKLKREQYALQKQQELNEIEYNKQLELEKKRLIQQEKEKLIQANAEILKNYYPKGYYRTLRKLETIPE